MKGNCGISKENKGKMKIKGLVVAGGALAVAGLFATFILKIRRKTRDNSNGKRVLLSKNIGPKLIEEDNGAQGLLCLLQTPPKTSSCQYMGDGDSSTMSVIIEEDGLSTKTDDGSETQSLVFSDYWEREITEFDNNVFGVEDGDGSNDEIPLETNEAGKETELVEEYIEEKETRRGTRYSSMDLQANMMAKAEKHNHLNGDTFINSHVTGKCMKMDYEHCDEGASKIRVWILFLLMLMTAIWLQKLT